MIIGWSVCDLQNNQGRGRGYLPKPKAEADNPRNWKMHRFFFPFTNAVLKIYNAKKTEGSPIP